MSRARYGSHQAGFTLLEAMIGMLLMSIIITALATVTGQWLPNWSRGLARVQGSQSTAIGLDRLVEDLGSAMWISTGKENGPPAFEGTSVSLSFVRTAIGPNAPIGLEMVRVYEASDDSVPTLVRSASPFASAADRSAGSQLSFSKPVALIAPPYRASFEFLDQSGTWRDRWDARAQLPRAVRILVRDAATARILLTTMAPIHTDLPARCVRVNSEADCPKVSSTSMFSAGTTPGGGGTR